MASIFDMGLKRVRNVASELRTQSGGDTGDLGFRVLKIDTSNMADVFYAPDALDRGTLDLFIDNIKPDRTPEDLLFQVMLDWGVDLALPIAKKTIQAREVYFVDANALPARFDSGGPIDEACGKELATHEPRHRVCRDSGLHGRAAKTTPQPGCLVKSPASPLHRNGRGLR